MKKLDLTNHTYGNLTVIEEAERYVFPSGKSRRQWKCLCSCGEEVVVRQGMLRNRVNPRTDCGCGVSKKTSPPAEDSSNQVSDTDKITAGENKQPTKGRSTSELKELYSKRYMRTNKPPQWGYSQGSNNKW